MRFLFHCCLRCLVLFCFFCCVLSIICLHVLAAFFHILFGKHCTVTIYVYGCPENFKQRTWIFLFVAPHLLQLSFAISAFYSTILSLSRIVLKESPSSHHQQIVYVPLFFRYCYCLCYLSNVLIDSRCAFSLFNFYKFLDFFSVILFRFGIFLCNRVQFVVICRKLCPNIHCMYVCVRFLQTMKNFSQTFNQTKNRSDTRINLCLN